MYSAETDKYTDTSQMGSNPNLPTAALLQLINAIFFLDQMHETFGGMKNNEYCFTKLHKLCFMFKCKIRQSPISKWEKIIRLLAEGKAFGRGKGFWQTERLLAEGKAFGREKGFWQRERLLAEGKGKK